MKKRILVANRSEIACRVFQACREMGFSPVGIVAPGDDDSRHVTYADAIYRVKSYLDMDSILQAVHRSQAQWVHPGYGFLSESPEFAQKIEGSGICFIGPQPEAMRQLGDKKAAKTLATRLGIRTLPWARVEAGQPFKKAAEKIGLPLLIKASAGGGGKGMRAVHHWNQLEDAIEAARAEAGASFGEDSLFLEKMLMHPRHIEVQVFGDGLGDGVHLHERECSLQRRHQKIWEEAPVPRLNPKTQEEMLQAALKLIRATTYRSAGTLEFLVDDTDTPYFLEMNTRLQVEHPVTELISGVDLVWAQIAQAQTPSVPVLTQSPSVRGHAIEVRLYAEDPAEGFMPSPGQVTKLIWPLGAGIRIESGVEVGQRIGTEFDSLLAKIIVHASTRQQALARLRFALEETLIVGVGTNQAYLKALLDHPKVYNGDVSTDFLENHFRFVAPELSAMDLQLWWTARQSERIPKLCPGVSEKSPWKEFFVQRSGEIPGEPNITPSR